MPPIIIPNIVRYSAQGMVGDRPWANIWDMRASGALDSREDVIRNGARRLFDAYAPMRPYLSTAWTLTTVRWVDLDSLGGSTGEVTSGDTLLAPYAGTSAQSPAVANAAYLVKKVTTGGRLARHGRSYIAGVPEGVVAVQNIEASLVDDLQTAMNTFLTTFADPDAWGPDESSDGVPVVVHQAADGTVSATNITGLTVQTRLATQRRRLRG